MTTIVWTILTIAYILFVAGYFVSLYLSCKRQNKIVRAFYETYKNRVTDSAPQGPAAPHISGNGEK